MNYHLIVSALGYAVRHRSAMLELVINGGRLAFPKKWEKRGNGIYP